MWMMWIGGLETPKADYYAIVESHIRYGILMWGGTSAENIILYFFKYMFWKA